jgi:hypothetical protein
MTFLANGFTWIKSGASTYSPLANLFVKTDSSTWTPVKTGWIKNSSGNWETIYPTPSGVFTSNVSSLLFVPYQYHSDTSPQYIQITNTGNWPLTVNSIITTGNSSFIARTLSNQTPFTLYPNSSTNVRVTVTGETVGAGFSGNITFINYTGYLGYANVTIPINVNVRQDYNGIQVSTNPAPISYYVLDSLPSVSVTITNSGNGANLNISSITSLNGYVTISNVPSLIGYNFSTFTGNSASFTATAANLAPGSYTDYIHITSDAQNAPTLTVPVNLTVDTTQGVQIFNSPGTTTWTVPDHVHQINYSIIGAGGSGGAGLNNNYALQGGSGGGGGSGAFANGYNISVNPGDSLTITVGAGGVAALHSGVNGSAGGSTSITGNLNGTVQTITIPGGGGGSAATDDGTNYINYGGASDGGGSGDGPD